VPPHGAGNGWGIYALRVHQMQGVAVRELAPFELEKGVHQAAGGVRYLRLAPEVASPRHALTRLNQDPPEENIAP
jgi:hypothetical protein